MNQLRSSASSVDDARFLREAIALAAQGPAVDPNPRVGCVIVADDVIVGRGWHAGAGNDHAEVVALADAGDRAAGATAYVSLEPCAHTGRTGPCAQALIAAGVARVVFARSDPNPSAQGGADILRAAGVEVGGGLLADDASALNPYWEFAMRQGRPFVTWKIAQSLDGCSAAADGTSKWITSAASRADGRRLRSQVGAILAGTGTVLADSAQLTARDDADRLLPRQPLRVVMGERDLPAHAPVLDDTAPTVQLRTHDPSVVLKELHTRQVHRLLIEGGPTVGAVFAGAGFVDEIVAYVAPLLLGDGLRSSTGLPVTTLGEAVELELQDVLRIGDDLRLTYRRK